MLTIEALKQFGADTADGLQRCMNMEEFYLNLVQTAMDDSQLHKLKDAIADGDLNAAFEIAHALKGVFANLSLTPLFTPTSQITELLRSRTQTDYAPLLAELTQQMEAFKKLAE